MTTAMPAARYVLALLFCVNLVNYLDRQILYALLPLIQGEMGFSDAQAGALASAFMAVYMCAAPCVAYFADRGRTGRTWFISMGLAFWSAATLLSGLARSYASLFAARAAVGVGESGYGAVSPSFVAEHFPEARRGWALAVFSAAIPVGSALGYLFGGWAGHHFGWRKAFWAAGLAGLALSALVWRLKDPREGGAADGAPPSLREYLTLYSVPSYVAATLAMAAMTFSLGGLAVWMPTFLVRAWGLNVAQSGTIFGGITVGAGLVGSLLGGWLGDKLLKVTGKAYFLVSGAGLALAVPAGILAVLSPSLPAALAGLAVAETLAFLNMGPLNGVIVAVTSARMRSMAFAANIFVIHALGDAVSPTIIGLISDRWDLRSGLVLAMLFMGISAALCLWGARHVERDSTLRGGS